MTSTTAAGPTLAQKVRGGCYCAVWYASILLGFYALFAPLLPLLLLNRRLYRRITDTLFALWEAFNVVSNAALAL